MRVRLSVFPLLDKQWRQNLVKKKKKNNILKRLYFMCCLFFVLPHFDVTCDLPLSEKTHSKILYKFPLYHLFIEPEDEHGGIDASTQQSQRESK